MPTDAKVSIITICYNAEKFLERTIKSVAAQTYKNIEYIIIDGRSKDATLDIIKKHENEIDFWKSEPDKNLYDAMNKGLKAATGDYVWFMNAGDTIFDEATLENVMSGAGDADLIYGEAVIVDEKGNTWERHKKPPRPYKLSKQSFLNGMVICHQSMIVKRSIAPEYDLRWKFSADIDWAIKVMEKARTFHYVDVPFCKYLEGGFSANNRLDSVLERFKISVRHFGLLSSLMEQVRIGAQAMRRGKIS